jgi:glycerate dehydrogenase
MNSKPRALFLDKASLYPDDLDFSELEKVADWQWFDNAHLDDIQHTLADADIIVSNKVVLDSAIIDRCEQLGLICVAATGVNNVDLKAAKRNEITVCNARAYATSSVVQHVFTLLLSLSRKLGAYQRSAHDRDWANSDFFCYFGEPFDDLGGKTLGVIGYGELGRAVAKVAACFGMKVLVARGHHEAISSVSAATVSTGEGQAGAEQRVGLKTLLSESDVVSLHCPLTEKNHHLIDEQALSLMKPESILINTARGGLVDEQALLQALKERQIAAAGLDVLAEEPPSVDNELLHYRTDNLIVTPHVAWASRSSRQRLVDEITENINAYLHGTPRNCV